jgi:hypothetical protein
MLRSVIIWKLFLQNYNKEYYLLNKKELLLSPHKKARFPHKKKM